MFMVTGFETKTATVHAQQCEQGKQLRLELKVALAVCDEVSVTHWENGKALSTAVYVPAEGMRYVFNN